jgi:flavin reductase (DIM6/NTAB) family NADH-FMN oxidoreductase RutF
MGNPPYFNFMHTTTEPTEPQKDLMAALGRIPSGLFVVSVRHGKQETAMLASWVQQCSFEPPLVSIAVNAKRWFIDWLVQGASLAISILGEGQKDLIGHFGKGFDRNQPAFEGIEVERHDGAPILKAAHAHLQCRLTATQTAGDHVLVIAQVESGKVQHEGRPGVHIRRSGSHY